MNYTFTFSEECYQQLTTHLFQDRTVERGAYALCKMMLSEEETRLLVREIIPIVDEDIIDATAVSMNIKPLSFLRAMKKADQSKQVFVFIHSHPKGFQNHSAKDDEEEIKLFRTAYNRISSKGVHASIVFSSPDQPVGRVWLPDSIFRPVSLIRVIGNSFRFYSSDGNKNPLPVFYDRQVRAFGRENQRLLSQLNIGVVGVGGTGSAVAEQLIRLGVGAVTISDGQPFEDTNVNRVYGSRVTDDKTPKISITQRSAKEIGLGTRIIPIEDPISYNSALSKFRNCDIIFGCTDDHSGRSILTRLSVYYNIPVFDMGVRIDSTDGKINSVQGRVTTLLPTYACLFCRGRIDPAMVRMESLEATDPKSAEELRKEGYVPELQATAPSVIPFTTAIASLAISELIHRLTGFMGQDRTTNEIIVRFDETDIRRNRLFSKPDCFCGDDYHISRGDTTPLLDLTWRPEK